MWIQIVTYNILVISYVTNLTRSYMPLHLYEDEAAINDEKVCKSADYDTLVENCFRFSFCQCFQLSNQNWNWSHPTDKVLSCRNDNKFCWSLGKIFLKIFVIHFSVAFYWRYFLNGSQSQKKEYSRSLSLQIHRFIFSDHYIKFFKSLIPKKSYNSYPQAQA